MITPWYSGLIAANDAPPCGGLSLCRAASLAAGRLAGGWKVSEHPAVGFSVHTAGCPGDSALLSQHRVTCEAVLRGAANARCTRVGRMLENERAPRRRSFQGSGGLRADAGILSPHHATGAAAARWLGRL